MKQIEVSIIIPFHRNYSELQECLKCIQRQSYDLSKSETIIVQNDNLAPPDLSHFNLIPNLKILRELRPGSYRARNTGIEHSKGELLFFTDSDALPHRLWIEEGVKALKDHSIVGGSIQLVFNCPARPTTHELYEKVFYFNQESYIKTQSYAATANLMVKKEVLGKIGPFDSSLRSSGDREWGRRASLSGYAIHYSDKSIVFHPSRLSFTSNLKRRVRVFSGYLYLRIRKYGLNTDGYNTLKNNLLSVDKFHEWNADWNYFNELPAEQQRSVLKILRMYNFLDYCILFIGYRNFGILKWLTRIDRLQI